MKKFITLSFTVIICALAIFLFIANFSATETKFKCIGQVKTDKENSQDLTLFLKLQEYRSWVGLWGDSDGALNIEVPNQWVDYYGDLIEVGDQLQINRDGNIQGNFSKLSKAIALKTHFGFFDGICTEVPK